MFFQNYPKPQQSERGQVLIIVLIFAVVFIALSSFQNGPLGQAVTNPTLSNGAPASQPNCIAFPPTPNKILPQMPAIEKGFSSKRRPTETTNFVHVRTKVPITKSFFQKKSQHQFLLQEVKEIDGKKYDVYYPEQFAGSGEVDSVKPIVSKYRHPGKTVMRQGRGQLYFSDFKIIFLVELGPDGKPLEVRGTDDHNKPALFWVTDIYQQEDELRGSPKSGAPNPLPDEIFSCGNQAPSATDSPPTLDIVDQDISSDKKELQLQYFLFKDNGLLNNPDGWSAHCKPAIYLYPPQPTQVNVKVNTKGSLTYTDPLYPQGGWNALANPNGDVIYQDKTYPYLYYESKVPDELIDIPTQGFTVEYNQLTNLYNYLLPKLGLNESQTKDFTEYWAKTLPYSTYYYVGIMDQKNIDEFEPLDITPKPDTNIRVRLYFQAQESKPTTGLNDLTSPLPLAPSPSDFTMVEWGGMIKLDKTHPFTCSQ